VRDGVVTTVLSRSTRLSDAPPDLPEALGVRLQGGDLPETAFEAREQALVEWPSGWAEGVVAPETIPPGANQAGTTQIGQVPGNPGLGDAKDFHDVPHANLRMADEMKNPQARRIREGTEQEIDIA
jgi:hypothetical protein